METDKRGLLFSSLRVILSVRDLGKYSIVIHSRKETEKISI